MSQAVEVQLDSFFLYNAVNNEQGDPVKRMNVNSEIQSVGTD
jgi:hypothetical protein